MPTTSEDMTERRAIHLLSVVKFVPWIRTTFQSCPWTSTYVFLYDKKSKIPQLDADITPIPLDREGIQQVVDLINQSDMAFYYLLDNTKAEIVRQVSTDVHQFWCFFGTEVYQQTGLFTSLLYGPATQQWLRRLPEIKFRYHLRKWYYQLQGKPTPLHSLTQAIPHIRGFLWYIEEEYNYLSRHIELPPYYYFQFFAFSDIVPNPDSQVDVHRRRILIGNSATVENNHADILKVLRKVSQPDIEYTLPLTYGQFARYKKKVIRSYTQAFGERVHFLSTHMPLEQYYTMLATHPTAIFNHFRQQALGNILYLIYIGCKVYLSDRNVVYDWLNRHSVRVFSFEKTFHTDASTGSLILNEADRLHNRQATTQLLQHGRNHATLQAIEQQFGAHHISDRS